MLPGFVIIWHLLIHLIKRDMLITAALLHDVGKTRELSSFPLNDYTDEGQLLGHIIIGAQMIHDLIKGDTGLSAGSGRLSWYIVFTDIMANLSTVPPKPAMVEAVALNLADNTDAHMETLTEFLQQIKA